MKLFKVLSTGQTNCKNTATLIEKVAQKKGIEIQIEQFTDLDSIIHYGVISTPAVILDEKLIHSGSIPQVGMIESWLTG